MDKISVTRRSANMSRIRSVNMKPEMVVRSAVHRLGYRFRLHRKDLPGKPDLVFAPRRKVIFVHGCFWHQHQKCIDGRMPKSNLGYWHKKLTRNIKRDAKRLVQLKVEGWEALVIWECETKNERPLVKRLRHFLD